MCEEVGGNVFEMRPLAVLSCYIYDIPLYIYIWIRLFGFTGIALKKCV